MGRDAENEVSDDMKMIQCELLHMFGAVMASSKVGHDHHCSKLAKYYGIPAIIEFT